MDTRDVAERLLMDRATVNAWINRGYVPGLGRIGRKGKAREITAQQAAHLAIMWALVGGYGIGAPVASAYAENALAHGMTEISSMETVKIVIDASAALELFGATS